jgi:hypothetical protein
MLILSTQFKAAMQQQLRSLLSSGTIVDVNVQLEREHREKQARCHAARVVGAHMD